MFGGLVLRSRPRDLIVSRARQIVISVPEVPLRQAPTTVFTGMPGPDMFRCKEMDGNSVGKKLAPAWEKQASTAIGL